MKQLAIAFVSLFALNASAHILTPHPVSDPAVGLSTGTVRQLQKTVVKLQMVPNERLSYCSIFPVTPDGYMLTALHCLRGCLLEMDAAEKASNDYLGLSELFVVREPGNVGATCAAFAVPALQVSGGVKIVATGPALALYDTNFLTGSSGYFQQLKERGWEAKANDFALIKIQTQSPLECLRLSTQRPRNEQDVWAIGYPGDTDQILSAARGHVFGRVDDSQTYRSQTTDEDRLKVRTQFGARGLIFSSAASAYGQSGGPIINASGQVIGIVSGFSVPAGKDRETAHELVGSDIANVLRGLPRETAAMLAKKNAACRSQAQ